MSKERKIIEKRCDPDLFEMILAREKNVDLRLNKFDAKRDDVLWLREFDRDPEIDDYTGREIKKEISHSYVLNPTIWFSMEDIKKMGFRIMEFAKMNKQEKMTIKRNLYNIFRSEDSWNYFCKLLKNKITGAITGDEPPYLFKDGLMNIIEVVKSFNCPYCDTPQHITADKKFAIYECFECETVIGAGFNNWWYLYTLKDEFFDQFLSGFNV